MTHYHMASAYTCDICDLIVDWYDNIFYVRVPEAFLGVDEIYPVISVPLMMCCAILGGF